MFRKEGRKTHGALDRKFHPGNFFLFDFRLLSLDSKPRFSFHRILKREQIEGVRFAVEGFNKM